MFYHRTWRSFYPASHSVTPSHQQLLRRPHRCNAIAATTPSSTVEQLLTTSLRQELQSCHTYGEFLVVVEEHLSYLNDQQTGKVLKHLTEFKLSKRANNASPASQQQLHAVLAILATRINACAHQYTPRQVASTLSSFAKLEWLPPQAVVGQLGAQLTGSLPQSNAQDISMTLWALAKLNARLDQQQLDAILRHTTAQLPTGSFGAQSIANITWALAGLDAQPSIELLQQVDRQLSILLEASRQQQQAAAAAAAKSRARHAHANGQQQQQQQQQQEGNSLTPQGLSNIMWAFAKLSHQPSTHLMDLAIEESAAMMSSASPQSLTNLAWALAQLQAQPGQAWQQQLWRSTSSHRLRGYSCYQLATLLQAVQQLQLQAPPSWLEGITTAAAGKLQQASPENLAVLLAALAAMHSTQPRQQQEQQQQQQQRFLAACYRQLAAPWLQQATPRNITTIATALVTLQQQLPQAAADNMLRAVFHKSPSFSPRDLVQVALAVPRLGIRPSMTWLQDYLAHVQQQLPAMNAQDLSNLLVAMVELWVLPEQVCMEELLQQYERQWGDFTCQGISNTLWALGRLQYKPSQAWLAACAAQLGSKLGSMSQQELTNSIWALGRLKVAVDRQLSDAIMAELVRRAPQLSSRALATSVWALAKLEKGSMLDQQRLHSTVGELMLQLQPRLAECSPQDFSNSLWALAKLRVQPPKDWLQDWVAASADRLGSFSGQAVANAVWALVKLSHRPAEAWVQRCLTVMHYMSEKQVSEQDWSTLQVALYRWGYISEDGEYEEVGDGRMVFTANIDPGLLSQKELQELQQEGEEEEEEGAYAEGPWLLSVKAGSRAGEMGWYGVDAVEWDVGGGLVSRVG